MWNWSLPLGTVRMTRMAFTVLVSIFENEAVCSLQTIRALFYTVWPILKMETLGAMVWPLESMKKMQCIEHTLPFNYCTRTAGCMLCTIRSKIEEYIFSIKNTELAGWSQLSLMKVTQLNLHALYWKYTQERLPLECCFCSIACDLIWILLMDEPHWASCPLSFVLEFSCSTAQY